MDKRYQVFVSSTYADLKEERQKVIQTIMEMDCIPSGMELFPAVDEEQWQFIKKIIDDCDYYLLIIGGRYGSLADDGISYTEKEYDYAIEKGLKVIALIHENPDSLPVYKTDKNSELAMKLSAFVEKVKPGRLVKFWKTSEELPGLVALSLSKTIKMYPAIGWVRANTIGSSELLNDINILRKENEELKKYKEKENEVKQNNLTPSLELANFDDIFTVHGEYKINYQSVQKDFAIDISWREIFSLISPYLIEYPSDSAVKSKLGKYILQKEIQSFYECKIDEQDFQTIRIQLSAYGLVSVTYSQTTKNTMAVFWSLTKAGNSKMIELRTIKKY